MFPGGLQTHTRLLVSYAGDDWLHERVVLSLPTHESICVVTPHWDVYVEQLSSYQVPY